MRTKLIATTFLLLPLFASATTLPKEKESVVAFCSTCHGVTGVSTLDHIPNLWGQSQSYLREQIEKFRDKKRHTTFMDAFIYQISDQQIDQVVKHYSSVPAADTFKLQWRGDKWPGDMQLGEKIAYTGKMDANVPACVRVMHRTGLG
ncbi:c-type cytochrome [Vibrio algicola]|uniref:C-type cytochrome n=1 Tax=Vibrio algicola TaxID=2662262 RepID=A0A5Q0TDV7_9VIBR|nr:c-type cytochrome [Vibrio algicola]